MGMETIRCRICGLLAYLLENPYQYSGQVIAKLSVNVATMIWSAVVFIKPDALARWPASFLVSNAVHENTLAAGLFVLSFIAAIRILFKSAPLRLGACVYGVFLLLWLYTWMTLIVAVTNGITAARPGQLAGVTVLVALAAFAFVSNPKRKRHGSPSD